MRILHLTPFLQGGSGRVITDLALEQHRGGHEVRVVASATGVPGLGNYQAYIDELTDVGVPVRQVDSLFHRQHAANLAVVRALDDSYGVGREPQVIHSHAAVPAMVGLLFAGARRASIATLQTMHGWGQVRSGDQVATDVTVLNLVDRVAAASRHSVETLVSLGVSPARIKMVPCGVRGEGAPLEDRDAELVVEMTRRRRQGALVAACVGTVGPRKNQALLVEAIGLLPDAPIFCVFIGDGDLEGLRAATERAGATARVRVHGYSRAARRVAAAADVLVLPSRSEGQPVSVVEAFCDGTLVAVSDIPELVELVGDDMGFRFRAGDAGALAETLTAIVSLPNSTRRTVRQRARAQYLSRFTVDSMASEYLAIYDAVVAERSRDRSGRHSSVA